MGKMGDLGELNVSWSEYFRNCRDFPTEPSLEVSENSPKMRHTNHYVVDVRAQRGMAFS